MSETRFPSKLKRRPRAPIRARRPIPPPPRASATIAAALRPLAAKFGPSVSEISTHWEDIVGSRVAARCKPISITGRGKGGGVLRVSAPGPAALLVEADAARILERVNDYCGRPVAKKLAIVRSGTARPEKKISRAARAAAAPIPTERLAAIDAGLEHVHNPTLRKALSRLGRAVETHNTRVRRARPNSESDT